MKKYLPDGVRFLFGVRKEDGPRAGKTELQSVLFNQYNWSMEQAKAWLAENGYLHRIVEESREYMRFRQKDPEGFFKYGVSHFWEGVEWHLRKAVFAGCREILDRDDLLNELQSRLEGIVYTLFEPREE